MGESKKRICKIADTVAKRVIERAKVGLKKYGVTVEKSDLPVKEWLQHLQDELMDSAIYIEKLKLLFGEADADEPYFGWCDVKECADEGCSGGIAWQETGHWTVCTRHADDYRAGKPQPKMKLKAIDRENSRDKTTGYLPIDSQNPC